MVKYTSLPRPAFGNVFGQRRFHRLVRRRSTESLRTFAYDGCGCRFLLSLPIRLLYCPSLSLFYHTKDDREEGGEGHSRGYLSFFLPKTPFCTIYNLKTRGCVFFWLWVGFGGGMWHHYMQTNPSL